MTIDQALERFLTQLRADGRSRHTLGQYERHVRLLSAWARDVRHTGAVGDLSHEDLARFLASPHRANVGPRRRAEGELDERAPGLPPEFLLLPPTRRPPRPATPFRRGDPNSAAATRGSTLSLSRLPLAYHPLGS